MKLFKYIDVELAHYKIAPFLDSSSHKTENANIKELFFTLNTVFILELAKTKTRNIKGPRKDNNNN